MAVFIFTRNLQIMPCITVGVHLLFNHVMFQRTSVQSELMCARVLNEGFCDFCSILLRDNNERLLVVFSVEDDDWMACVNGYCFLNITCIANRCSRGHFESY